MSWSFFILSYRKDLQKIAKTIADYYAVITTYDENKRIIKYYNSTYFLVSDKDHILFVSDNFLSALIMFVKIYVYLKYKRIKQILRPDLIITINNVNKKIYFCKGALKAAEILNNDVEKLERYFID